MIVNTALNINERRMSGSMGIGMVKINSSIGIRKPEMSNSIGIGKTK